MKRRRSRKHRPEKIEVQPIADFSRKPVELPPASAVAEAAAPQVSLPTQRGRLARASASPRSAAIPTARMISAAKMESRALARRRRRERRRQRRKLRTMVVCSVLAAAFAAGFLWKIVAAKMAGAPAAPAASAERRDEALRLMDDAVRAKHEGRSDAAVAAASAARKADPAVRGVDVLVGSLALEAGQPETLRQAAEQALLRHENVAEANLLLALHKWMMRGQSPGTQDASALVEPLLAEASEAEPSNMEVMFFWGDMASYAGHEDLAHRRLLGGLHRQQPWLSSATLAAKMELAAEEAAAAKIADAQKIAPPPPTPAGKALADLRRAALSGADPKTSLAALRGASTAWQAKLLLGDQAFVRPGIPPDVARARNAPVANIPGETIAPPDNGTADAPSAASRP